MNEAILIIGGAGTGKTTSIRTLDPNKTFIINTAGKRLPFRNNYTKLEFSEDKKYKSGNMIEVSNIAKITKMLTWLKDNTTFINIVIEDFQFAMAFEMFDRLKEKSFDKWVDIGQEVRQLFKAIMELPEHILVFIFIHTEVAIDLNGNKVTKAKTIGQLIDKNLTIEGLTTIVLGTEVVRTNNKSEYYFVTENDGTNTLRSPMGMFEDYRIPNDLLQVSNIIREYHNLSN